MAENERQQRLVERVQEDERLRGDLEGAAAAALVEWASRRVMQAAADPDRPDGEVEAEAEAIRAAARKAARSGEPDPARVVALAEAALGQAAEAPPAAVRPRSAPARRWGRPVRRRWRERFRRWFRRKEG